MSCDQFLTYQSCIKRANQCFTDILNILCIVNVSTIIIYLCQYMDFKTILMHTLILQKSCILSSFPHLILFFENEIQINFNLRSDDTFVIDLHLLGQAFLQTISVPYQVFVHDTRIYFLFNHIENTFELLIYKKLAYTFFIIQ